MSDSRAVVQSCNLAILPQAGEAIFLLTTEFHGVNYEVTLYFSAPLPNPLPFALRQAFAVLRPAMACKFCALRFDPVPTANCYCCYAA